MDAWKACACLLCMLVCGVPAAAGRRLQQVTWVVDTNISYEGNDLADARAPNANACSYLCLAYRGAAPCTAFTWSPAGMCWLKSAAAGSKAAEGFMSGRISGGPQPAATAAATAAAAVAVQAPTQPQPGAAEVAGPVAGPQAAPAPGGWRRDWRGLEFNYQLGATFDLATDRLPGVAVYVIDGFLNNATVIQGMLAAGLLPLCYISVGTAEDYRPDHQQFEPADMGLPLPAWPQERWLDVRRANVRRIMQARINMLRDKGCVGMEADNVDHFWNNPGFAITPAEIGEYVKWLADLSHAAGMGFGLKNAMLLLTDPVIVEKSDFAINEECHKYKTCGDYAPLREAGRAIWNVEYFADFPTPEAFRAAVCPLQAQFGLISILKTLDLKARPWEGCPSTSAATAVTNSVVGGGVAANTAVTAQQLMDRAWAAAVAASNAAPAPVPAQPAPAPPSPPFIGVPVNTLPPVPTPMMSLPAPPTTPAPAPVPVPATPAPSQPVVAAPAVNTGTPAQPAVADVAAGGAAGAALAQGASAQAVPAGNPDIAAAG